ncbi:MAG: electron transfer flavoprotein beta subunit/FixA family protein [Gemmatimonadetes bacterium]|nr:electron transfer flavoprotein subunit beta/FixA family protein [Gemmatimonadota bacterium]NIR78857.1 electron transfer flavoprotein subunit beta/FixA family protein [Gemmatimonadota bacterium]NIT87494.1 electron transfer flavoprotein subunit beta/FixA family protein [Gemmatimonadota bacterium]NIU31363.1 electron transfer flavoprotein subunit beta/FixA family protein [Gemmatimonadota bacterium]NIU36042.1 electron transfer flavoprotein beta subunit/FixA family protein [Gemmatimonadota bacteri
MKISVCIKRVPDTETRIRIADDGVSIDTSGVKYIVSPYDEFAVEAALRMKEEAGEGEVVAVSLGDESSRETLRSALAMGADRALLLQGSVTMDGLATAKALAAEVEDSDLVLFGIKAADDDQQQVGPMVATLLDRPCATAVSDFEVSDGTVVARREVEGGLEIVELELPAVVTVTKGEFEPRYASLKGIMAAKKKPMEEKAGHVPESRVTVHRLDEPPERPEGRIVGEGAEAVSELVRLLREEANVL